MAIKVKAVERKLKFTKNENDPGVYRYVLGAELYVTVCLAPCDGGRVMWHCVMRSTKAPSQIATVLSFISPPPHFY